MGNRICEKERIERKRCSENHTQAKKTRFSVVADTNIFISGIFWTGASYKFIRLAETNIIDVFISKEIISELVRVLKRDFDYPDNKIKTTIYSICLYAKMIELKNIPDVVKNDSSDNHILACALEADADYIITGDYHLLDIKEYSGIKIIKPEEFLEVLK